MIFLDGRKFTGEPPGLRTVQRSPLMLVYLTGARRRTRGHHPGELDQLTQAATEDVLGTVPSALANRDFKPLFK
jgi:hypothetical protein